MGKKKKNGGKRGGNRFFRWIRSDLPDEEDKKSPVLLLGVNKISDSPSFVRRRSIDHSTGSIRFFRPVKSKYTRGLNEDLRLEKIRQDLLVHKTKSDKYIPKSHDVSIERDEICLQLNCSGSCICDRKRSSNRGSFSFHRPEQRQSSVCPSEPYNKTENRDNSEQDIEFKYTEFTADSQPGSSKQNSYNVTPKSADRRSFLLSNLNERFRKTLSLDSRKIETNRVPLSLPKETRPKSLVNTSNIIQLYKPDESFLNQFDKQNQRKKKRKSFFSLDTFFDSKKSDTSSVDDFCSSKYKRFELEEDSPLLRRDLQNQREKTPDLLNLPVIIDSVRKKKTDTRKQLEKLESHYYKSLKTKTIIDSIPKDATTESIQNSHSNHVFIDDDDVEYIEPIGSNSKSNFTSQSTLILDKNIPEKPESVLTIYTDETDIRLPSSTVSPKSDARGRENDLDSIGAYEIEVKESDLLKASKVLTVKVMDKSVDSIGSCSLDVDASTDFSDTTSGSLNLLTPSSTTSRIREFNSRFQERANQCLPNYPTPTVTPIRTPDDATPTPRKAEFKKELKKPLVYTEEYKTPFYTEEYKNPEFYTEEFQNPEFRREESRTPELKSAEFKHTEPRKFEVKLPFKNTGNLLKPPSKIHSDTSSHRSRGFHKKRDDIQEKKPSYLNLACSVNGYTNLTTYDSKLRQDINKSREASPIRPITHTYQCKGENPLLVPVPISANKLLVPKLEPHDTPVNLTQRAPTKAHTDPYLSSATHVYMAEENKQLKNDFLGANMTTTSRPFISNESKNFASSMLHQDEVDNAKEVTFKSSYSETNFRKTVNGKESTQRISSESYTISSNGVSKRVEITKENGETLTSPMKSFIQQRVERLYGPGALAQGFLMQKRQKKSTCEDDKVLTEKSLNCQSEYCTPKKSDVEVSSPNGEDSNVALPVLRHLRPEFRAQLEILSPKKSVKSDISPQKDQHIPLKTEDIGSSVNVTSELTDPSVKSVTDVANVTNGVSVIKLTGEVNGNAIGVNGEVVKDAYYFLALEKKETERLMALSASADKELENLQGRQDVSEEILGFLRSASGKARLLATQKMQQFEGLCYNNINESSDSPFPTTVEDLQGFWDMVCLQVTNVDAIYRQVAELKQNNWQEISTPTKKAPAPTGVPRRRATPQVQNEKARLAAQKREADRKTMLEHRRRLARERQLASQVSPGTSAEPQHGMAIEGSQEVEIFVGKNAKPSKVAPKGDCMSAQSDDSAELS